MDKRAIHKRYLFSIKVDTCGWSLTEFDQSVKKTVPKRLAELVMLCMAQILSSRHSVNSTA